MVFFFSGMHNELFFSWMDFRRSFSHGWLLAEARKRALSRRFVAWVVCLLMGMGGLVVGGLGMGGLVEWEGCVQKWEVV